MLYVIIILLLEDELLLILKTRLKSLFDPSTLKVAFIITLLSVFEISDFEYVIPKFKRLLSISVILPGLIPSEVIKDFFTI